MPPDGAPIIRSFGVDDFDVVYQPIVDCADGALFAHEALVRCRHPSYANPALLFHAASEQKSCGHLGRIIRQVAFARCDHARLFVNVHPDELSSRWLVRPDDPMGFHGEEVYLEVTETAAFTHFELCMDVLREVCERTGAHLVVDDFGAGHSNMQRVVDLRPSIVKLDGALVRGIDRDQDRQRIVSEVIAVFSDLGAKVVAECVETVAELQAVRELGVHYAQGFLIAKPQYPLPPVSWPIQRDDQQRDRISPPPGDAPPLNGSSRAPNSNGVRQSFDRSPERLDSPRSNEELLQQVRKE